jgi:hypothetical protein
MRFGSTPEGKDGSTPSAAYVEAAENMRRSLKRLSAASEAADLILMRSTAAVVAADEEKKCADRGGLEATFIDAFRGAEKGDARRSPKAKSPAAAKASPEPANDFERQFLAAYRKYAATPSPVPALKEEIVPSAWIPSMPPTPEANKPAPASPRANKSAPSSKKSPTAKVTRESTKPKPKPATSMEAARASLARLNAATNAKDGEYTPPSPQQQQPNVVEEPKAESPAVKLFSEKMSAPSPVKPAKTRTRRGDYEGTGQPGRRRFGFRRRSTSRLGRKRGHSQVPRHARATTRRVGEESAHLARREPQFTSTRKFQGYGGDAETGHRSGRHLRPGGARAGARAGQGQA